MTWQSLREAALPPLPASRQQRCPRRVRPRPLCFPGSKPSRPALPEVPSPRGKHAWKDQRFLPKAPSSPAVPPLRPATPRDAPRLHAFRGEHLTGTRAAPRPARAWLLPPHPCAPRRPSSPAFPEPEVTALPRRPSSSRAVTHDAAVPEIKSSAPGHPRHRRQRPGRSTRGLK